MNDNDNIEQFTKNIQEEETKVKLKQQLLELQLKERDLLSIRTYNEIKEKRKKQIKRNNNKM